MLVAQLEDNLKLCCVLQQVFDSIAKAYEAILTLVETALNSDTGKNLVEQLNQLKDDYITGAKEAAEEEARA